MNDARRTHIEPSRAASRWWRLRRFLQARLDRHSELGLGLTIAVLLFAGGVWAFGGLLEEVLDAEALVRWDFATNEWVRRHESATSLRFFHGVTQLGSPVVWILMVLVSIWLVSRREHFLLWLWLAANAGGLLLQFTIKRTVHRTRPQYASAYLHGTGYSFPSGHTMNATIGFLMLAYIVCVVFGWRGSRRVAAHGVAIVLAIAVGLSRLVLGVHFPSDVIAGLIAGGAWLGACFSVAHIVRWRARNRRVHPVEAGTPSGPAPEAPS